MTGELGYGAGVVNPRSSSSPAPHIGLIDLPLDPSTGEDQLDISHYYDGLAKFVRTCETPMTIAVQGDWGTGKTTTLNFVRSRLVSEAPGIESQTGKIKVIEFNTWLYSQFDLGDALVFSLAHEIIQPISAKADKAKKLLTFLASVGSGLAVGGANVVGKLTSLEPLSAAVVESLRNATYSDQAPNLIADLKDVRNRFADAVKEYCEREKVDRIAILIDDLDRVDPRRAIEILESLKLFFEVENCVFILAVDFDVVVRGVGEKYGTVSPRKARQYFDKIIQVPFSMPVGAYKVDRLLEANPLLSGAGNAGIEQIVRAAVGTNPRSIKRLLNSFELLRMTSQQELSSEVSHVMIALVCAQTSYPRFHAEIVDAVYLAKFDTDEDALTELFVDAPLDSLAHEKATEYLAYLELERHEYPAFAKFRSLLAQLLAVETDNPALDVLRQAVKLTQVTAVGAPLATDETADGLQEASDSDVRTIVARHTTEATASIVVALLNQLKARLEQANLPLAWLIQESQRHISLYAQGDAHHVLALGPRARRRVAGISFNRGRVRVSFGRRDPHRTDDKDYGAEWDALVAKLDASDDVRLQVVKAAYPLTLDAKSVDDVPTIIDWLVQAYDVSETRR